MDIIAPDSAAYTSHDEEGMRWCLGLGKHTVQLLQDCVHVFFK